MGGPAEFLLTVYSEAELIKALCAAQRSGLPWFILGGGSNVCVSDHGVRGVTILNRATEVSIAERINAASGCGMSQLFLQTACAGLGGLEFAVGIPGTLAGALVSNAGAYRHALAPLVALLRIVEEGEIKTVGPEWMEFGYRDSKLRRQGLPTAGIVGAELRLEPRSPADIWHEAREYQRNRIFRQPWAPSAGSFFKNVYDAALAQRLHALPEPLKEAGVVPAGYLSDACGCRGLRCGDAEVSRRHANFIINRGRARAADIRTLAEQIKARVYDTFGVMLEEEVLYVGEWHGGGNL